MPAQNNSMQENIIGVCGSDFSNQWVVPRTVGGVWCSGCITAPCRRRIRIGTSPGAQTPAPAGKAHPSGGGMRGTMTSAHPPPPPPPPPPPQQSAGGGIGRTSCHATLPTHCHHRHLPVAMAITSQAAPLSALPACRFLACLFRHCLGLQDRFGVLRRWWW